MSHCFPSFPPQLRKDISSSPNGYQRSPAQFPSYPSRQRNNWLYWHRPTVGDKGATRGPKQLLLLHFGLFFCSFFSPQSMNAQAVLAWALQILGKGKIPQLESPQGQAPPGSVHPCHSAGLTHRMRRAPPRAPFGLKCHHQSEATRVIMNDIDWALSPGLKGLLSLSFKYQKRDL